MSQTPPASPRSAPKAPCPTCAKLVTYRTDNPWRPFCSERCKTIDLGAWASEQYRIAGNPQEPPLDEDGHGGH